MNGTASGVLSRFLGHSGAAARRAGSRPAWRAALAATGAVMLAGLLLLSACQPKPAAQEPTAAPAQEQPTGVAPNTSTGEATIGPATGDATPAMASATLAPLQTSEAPATDTTGLAAPPGLQSPENGANVEEGTISLTWSWPGELQADEYFEVRVWQEGASPRTGVAWLKETSYTLQGLPQGAYYWSVVVVRESTADDGSKKYEQVSQESEVRWLGNLPTASYSASLARPVTAMQVTQTGGILGLGLILGLFAVPAWPQWLARLRRRR